MVHVWRLKPLLPLYCNGCNISDLTVMAPFGDMFQGKKQNRFQNEQIPDKVQTGTF